jgi:signal transduction histidine kinase
VRCDAARLEQVINNLVSNAIKYSPGGGDVLVTVQIQQAQAVVLVSDHGLGIDPDEQKRIFEPFARAHPGRISIGGAGLGLFVAKRIVEAHGGHIGVESVPGKGTRFAVALPRARHVSLS